MDAQELAEKLYSSFWERNGVTIQPFEEQAKAIIRMWVNIAQSALDAMED